MENLDHTEVENVSSSSSLQVDDSSAKVKTLTTSCEAVKIADSSSNTEIITGTLPSQEPATCEVKDPFCEEIPQDHIQDESSNQCGPSDKQEKDIQCMEVDESKNCDEKKSDEKGEGPMSQEQNVCNSEKRLNVDCEKSSGKSGHVRTSSEGSREKSKRHKKKHRAGKDRYKKRKYKPYLSLSWREQQKIDDRLARRAQVLRDQMIAHGTPLAPYNTTQFIMNDHYVEEPDYEKLKLVMGSDSEWENEQFTEHYEELQDEYWKNLGDDTLAEQCIQLEDQIEQAEKQLTEVRKHKQDMGLHDKDPDAEYTKIFVLRNEIMKLLRENESLVSKNTELKKILGMDISGQ